MQGIEPQVLMQNFPTHVPGLSHVLMRRCVKLSGHHKAAHSLMPLSCSFHEPHCLGKRLEPLVRFITTELPWELPFLCILWGGGRYRKRRGIGAGKKQFNLENEHVPHTWSLNQVVIKSRNPPKEILSN